MKQILLLLNLLTFTYISAQVTTIISPTINNGGFEQGLLGWTVQNNNGENKWVTGNVPTVGYSGNKCALISNSITVPYSHQYNFTSASISKIYKDVVFPANTANFNLKFKTLVQGSNSSNLYVYLLPSTQVLNSIEIPNGSPLATYSLQGPNWIEKNISISNSLLANTTSSSTKKLVFVWRNDISSGSTVIQPPATIDDITIDNCNVPANITSINEFNQATINWESLDTSWTIRYKLATATTWTEIPASSKPFLLSSLTVATNYKFQVKNATIPCSDWSNEFSFTTTPINNDCSNAILIDPQDNVESLVKVVGSFVGANMTIPTPNCNTTFTNLAGNVWYKFTANSEKYIIDANSFYRVELFKGNDCNNMIYQYCKNGTSYLDNLEVGSQYYFRLINLQISQFSSSNDFTFRLVKSPIAPINDLCTNAILLTTTVQSGNLAGANLESDSPTLYNLANEILGDVWFKFVATENFATIVLTPSIVNNFSGFGTTGLRVSAGLYTGNCGTLTLFQSFSEFDPYSGGNGKDTNQLQIGQTYYLRVYGNRVNRNWQFGASVIPQPSPINDLCENAIQIPLDNDGETSYNTFYSRYLTPSVGLANNCVGSSAKDMWYKITANATKYLISNPYVIGLYSGSCDNLVKIGCGSTFVIGNLVIGQDYYIRVFDGGQTLKISEFPAEDECITSLELFPALDPTFIYSSTIAATPSTIASSCYLASNDIWFKFTATSIKHQIVVDNGYDSPASGNALSLSVYSGNCNALTEINCYLLNGQSALPPISNFVIGQIYYLKVSRSISRYFGIKVVTIPTQPNDELINATVIVPDNQGTCTQISGSTNGATASSGYGSYCNVYSNDTDVWYSFIAVVNSYKFAFSYAYAGSHKLAIYKEISFNNLQPLSCSLQGNLSGFEIGSKYYLRISNYSSTGSQNYSICISKIINAPVNDECANATLLAVSPTPNCSENIVADLRNATYNLIVPTVNTNSTSGSASRDIWYKFTAISDKLLIKNTISTTIINSFSCTLKQNNCNNNDFIVNKSIANPNTAIFYNLVIGTEYLLKISSTNYLDISFCLSTPAVVLNEDCLNAINIIPSATLTCATNTEYFTATNPSISLNVSGCGTNNNLYLYNPSIQNYGDVWYKFTATSAEHVVTFIINNETIMQLYTGDCNNLVCTTSFNNNNSFFNTNDRLFSQLTIGQVYYIRFLSSTSYGYGKISFCLKTPKAIPANNEPENAINLTSSPNLDICNPITNFFNRATHTTTVPDPTCAPSSSEKDIWYKFTATAPNHQLYIYLANPLAVNLSFHTTLYSSISGNINQEVACFNPFDSPLNVSSGGAVIGGGNQYSVLSLQNYYNLTIGETYFIRMYSFIEQTYDNSIEENFEICLKTLPVSPVNKTILTAINLNVADSNNLQYVTGYATRSPYQLTVPNNPTTNCYELQGYSSNAASNVWYKFTATQSTHKLNIINSANVLFPATNYTTDTYYNLLAVLYEYNGTLIQTKKCAFNTATMQLFDNLIIGKEYYIKIMFPQIHFLTDFEFQIGVSNATTLGAKNQQIASNLSIYPNPVNDILSIENKNSIDLDSIEVLNMLGQSVIKFTDKNQQILDVSSLQSGTYFLKIKTIEGSSNLKFIKK